MGSAWCHGSKLEGFEENKVGIMNTKYLGHVKAKDSKLARKKANQWWGGEYTVDSVLLSKNEQSLFAPDKEYDAFGHPRIRRGVRGAYRGPR